MERDDKIICGACGKEILPGTRPDRIPNGVGYVLEGGDVVNVCATCLIGIGRVFMEWKGAENGKA